MTTFKPVALSLVLCANLAVAGLAHAQRPLAQPAPVPGADTTPLGRPAASDPAATSSGAPLGSASPVTTYGGSEPMKSDYVIGPGDVLQVSVWKNETLSRVVPVRPDGRISMPLLHDVQAAGLTAMQLRDKIATALGEFLPHPEVSVSVNEVRSLRISVLGEVQRPGVIELRGSTTILEAIALAGGFRDFASPSKITILRNDENGKTQRIRFNYNRAIGSAGEENLVLKSGDVVVIP
jgi:polysaccharide export outer membrane protein